MNETTNTQDNLSTYSDADLVHELTTIGASVDILVSGRMTTAMHNMSAMMMNRYHTLLAEYNLRKETTK